MKVASVQLLVLMLPVLAGCPQPVEMTSAEPTSHTLSESPEARLMAVLDANDDGWLSAGEVRAVSRRKGWEEMDTSRDGKVDLVELRKFIESENPIKPELDRRRRLKSMGKRKLKYKSTSSGTVVRP